MCSVLPHVDLHRSYSKSCTQLEHHNWASQLNGAWRSGQCAMQRPHMPGKWIHTTASRGVTERWGRTRGWSSSWWQDCRGTHSPVTLSSPVTSWVWIYSSKTIPWLTLYEKKRGSFPLSSWRLERGSPSPGPHCSSSGQGGVSRSWRGWEKEVSQAQGTPIQHSPPGQHSRSHTTHGAYVTGTKVTQSCPLAVSGYASNTLVCILSHSPCLVTACARPVFINLLDINHFACSLPFCLDLNHCCLLE